jgi:hypothetical protein
MSGLSEHCKISFCGNLITVDREMKATRFSIPVEEELEATSTQSPLESHNDESSGIDHTASRIP